MENHLLLKTMLRRSALCMCFVAVSVVGFAAKTNSITIEYFSAQKQKYELTRLGYLELDGKEMIVRDKSGNLLYKAPIGDVKKVVLSDLDERTKVDNIADMSMVVYPNPTMDELFVQGMQVGDVLRGVKQVLSNCFWCFKVVPIFSFGSGKVCGKHSFCNCN